LEAAEENIKLLLLTKNEEHVSKAEPLFQHKNKTIDIIN
jgi:hypothetical protein